MSLSYRILFYVLHAICGLALAGAVYLAVMAAPMDGDNGPAPLSAWLEGGRV